MEHMYLRKVILPPTKKVTDKDLLRATVELLLDKRTTRKGITAWAVFLNQYLKPKR